MHPHRHPIPLYPNPPYTQDELLSDASSDFPPIRICKSSPFKPQSSPRSQRLTKGHRSKNDPKTVEVTVGDAKTRSQTSSKQSVDNAHGSKNVHKMVEVTVRDAKIRSRTSSKRNGDLDVDSRPSKRSRLTPLETHDMEWLNGKIHDMMKGIRDIKSEISDIKESLRGIEDYLKDEVGYILAEVVYTLGEQRDT